MTLHSIQIVLAALAATLIAPLASAQTSPTWNRELVAVSVMPESDGSHTIRAVVKASADDLTADIDLDTIVELFINGTLVGSTPLPFNAGPCGSCGFFEMCVCGTNPNNGVFDCSCSSILSFAPFNHNGMQPGDEIMVLLRPAPNAVPEQNTGDDLDLSLFDGPRTWNRRLHGVSHTVRADGGLDLHLDMDVVVSYDGVLDLSSVVEVRVDGVSYGEFPGPVINNILWDPCGGVCGDPCAFDASGGQPGVCIIDDAGFGGCGCGVAPAAGFTVAVPPLPPGTLEVILRPAPGALPELPGFPDDEAGENLCPTDIDADGQTGFTDLLAVLSAWGPCGDPCPADIDEDGTVGFTDLIMILSAWGPCFPV